MSDHPVHQWAGDGPAGQLRSLLPDTASWPDGSLSIGGCDVGRLAEEHGTPLYIYDVGTLHQTAGDVLATFSPLGARVSFAAKACATLSVLRTFSAAGLSLDVVSAGELEAGLRAGFPPHRIHLHGNCKSEEELEAAVGAGIRAVVLDNLEELALLEQVCARRGRQVDVMARIALPLEAETHPHLQTSGAATKFGVYLESPSAAELIHRASGSRNVRLVGLHAHLGSQIADAALYPRAAEQLLQLATDHRRHAPSLREISVGGGWAVRYTPDDVELRAREVAAVLQPVFAAHPQITPAVEPGRSLVARAGVAVYRIGAVKPTLRGRIVAVDGGMGDNPRPALYGARYCVLAAAPRGPTFGPVDLVGRYCESGDVLARDAVLPEVQAGDLAVVPVSGAYQLAMSSTYNLVPPPAVVMVSDGESRLVMRRGTVDELLARNLAD